jgi:hypothetical protein
MVVASRKTQKPIRPNYPKRQTNAPLYLFVSLKKKLSNTEKILQNLKNPTHPNSNDKNTEGPILVDS